MMKSHYWGLMAAVFAVLQGMADSPFAPFGRQTPLPLRPIEADSAANVVVFQPNWLQPILPDTEPRPGEEKVSLKTFAALGEYECMVFAVRADRGTRLRLNMTPLVSTNGDSIGADHFELRFQRTLNTHKDVSGHDIITPLGLDLADELPLPPDETVAIALDIKVPEDATPGLYKASIQLTGSAAPIELPVLLRVLPFRLIRGVRSYGSYFPGRYLTDPYRSRYTYASEAMLKKVFQAHHAYGFNSAQFCEVSPRMHYADGRVTADFSELETIMATWLDAGGDGLVSFDIRFSGWWIDELSVVLENRYSVEPKRYTIEELEAVYPSLNQVEPNLKARWHKDYRLSETAKKLYRQFCRQVLDLIAVHGWKNIYITVEEEAGNGGLKLWGLEQFGPIWNEFPEANVLFYDNSPHLGIDLGHKYKEWIKIRQYNFITPELVATAREDGRPLWYYNRGWNRAAFGFPIWKLDAGGMHMWADQWLDVPPYVAEQSSYPAWSVFQPSPEGPLPTLEGIRAREGIDDLAYLDTLLNRIANLDAAGKQDLTEKARQSLAQLKEKLPLTNAEFNDYRLKMTVESAFTERWKLAAQILRLDKELNDVR